METIEVDAFESCQQLETIHIPPSTTYLGDLSRTTFLLGLCSLRIVYVPSALISYHTEFAKELNHDVIILTDNDSVFRDPTVVHCYLTLQDVDRCLQDMNSYGNSLHSSFHIISAQMPHSLRTSRLYVYDVTAPVCILPWRHV